MQHTYARLKKIVKPPSTDAMNSQMFRNHANFLGLKLEKGWDVGDPFFDHHGHPDGFQYAYQLAYIPRNAIERDKMLVSFIYLSSDPGIMMRWYVGDKINRLALTDEQFLALTQTDIINIKYDVLTHIHTYEEAMTTLKNVMPSLKRSIKATLSC